MDDKLCSCTWNANSSSHVLFWHIDKRQKQSWTKSQGENTKSTVCLPSVGGHLQGIRCGVLDACTMTLLGDLVQTKERLFPIPASLGIPERRKGGSLLSWETLSAETQKEWLDLYTEHYSQQHDGVICKQHWVHEYIFFRSSVSASTLTVMRTVRLGELWLIPLAVKDRGWL